MPDDPDQPALPDGEAAAVPTDDIVEQWFATHFHNSIISRDTETFNHVRGAVDSLKRHLASLADWRRAEDTFLPKS